MVATVEIIALELVAATSEDTDGEGSNAPSRARDPLAAAMILEIALSACCACIITAASRRRGELLGATAGPPTPCSAPRARDECGARDGGVVWCVIGCTGVLPLHILFSPLLPLPDRESRSSAATSWSTRRMRCRSASSPAANVAFCASSARCWRRSCCASLLRLQVLLSLSVCLATPNCWCYMRAVDM